MLLRLLSVFAFCSRPNTSSFYVPLSCLTSSASLPTLALHHLLQTLLFRACSSLALPDLASDAACCFAADGQECTGDDCAGCRGEPSLGAVLFYSISYSWFSFRAGGEQLLLWLSSQLVKPWWPPWGTADACEGKRTFEYLLMV